MSTATTMAKGNFHWMTLPTPGRNRWPMATLRLKSGLWTKERESTRACFLPRGGINLHTIFSFNGVGGLG